MAVAQNEWSEPKVIAGLSLGVAASGIKYPNRNDTSVMVIAEGATVAGVFTKNAFAAAPITVCRQHLAPAQSGTQGIRALVINSGNANACTGESGVANALRSCQKVAEVLGVDASQVLPFSTGVIGEPLPIERLEQGIPKAIENVHEDNWSAFAVAIMTTDTRPKAASASFEYAGHTINVSGVAKGSGMINPNMATMLAYVATDAAVAPELLQALLLQATERSFNRITIDGDTSTNDACVLVATGKSTAPVIDTSDSELYAQFEKAVVYVHEALAKQVVQDGEGATKFVEVKIRGGRSSRECLNVAYAIAHSPLVKTAISASDPNWGRIVAAIGYADIEALDTHKVRVWLDDVLIVEHGGKASSYREQDGKAIFMQESFAIEVDLGRGDAEEKLWTTDLSHEYIRINAEYRS